MNRNLLIVFISYIMLVILSCSDTPKGEITDNDGGTTTRCSSNSECKADEYCNTTLNKCVKRESKDGGGSKICNPGDKGCYNQYLSVCNEDGTEWEITPCKSGEYCENGECTSAKCIPGERQCTSDGKLQICNATTKKFDTFNCPANTYCLNNVCINVICVKGETRCSGDGRLQTCNEKGTGFVTTDCPKNQICDLNGCKDIICKPNTTECSEDGMFLKSCNNAGTNWDVRSCGAGYVCDRGGSDGNGDPIYACLKQQCIPKTERCSPDNKEVQVCDDKGANYVTKEDCEGKNAVCINNQCVPRICQPNYQECDTNNANTLKICNELGTEWNLKGCGAGMVCVGNSCVVKVCSSGYKKCDGNKVVQCNANGTGFDEVEECTDPNNVGNHCENGRCMTLCDKAEAEKSYIGCEYWPTVTMNSQLGTGFSFAIAISNTQKYVANITIYRGNNVVSTTTVNPNEVKTVVLPWINELKLTYRSEASIKLANGAYTLVSNIPVTVYQFNPLEYQAGSNYTYTNDASILLPTSALGYRYYIYSYKNLSVNTGGSVIGSPSGFVIVATKDSTNVSINFSFNTLSGSGLPAYSKGQTANITLNKGEVIQIAAAMPTTCPSWQGDGSGYSYCDLGQDYDATGTYIQSDKPIAVFGVHNCAFIPFNRWACDHMEENLFPVEIWGMNYVITHTISKQNPAEPNLYRIISAFDNNTITFNPSSVQSSRTLNKGQWFEFYSTADFEVKGTAAFSVAQYLVGEDYNGYNSHTSDMGDPAMSLGIPVEQYRDYYNFLTPATYTESYVNITAPSGQQVLLDGSPVGGFTPIGSGKYSVARVKINAGQHTVSSSVPVGIVVYGYARYTSYAYPGGLNLIPINK